MASLVEKLFFSSKGLPRGWLRKVLKRRNGKIRHPLRRIVYKKSGALRPKFVTFMGEVQGSIKDGVVSVSSGATSVSGYLDQRWQQLRPLTVFPETGSSRRLTLVTDSVGPSSLFGGVGTALILAALWARRMDVPLRIVTRTEQPVTTALASVLENNRISFEGPVEYLFAPHMGASGIAVGPDDMFMATSWWTARSLLNTVPASRIVYLLQEDERMFYNLGDDHLACGEVLQSAFARVIVNSRLLFEHLTDGPNPVRGLSARASYFEPAFPHDMRDVEGADKSKKDMFFYARPQNPRNLFLTGLRLIDDALLQGILNPQEWRLHLVGRGLPTLKFRDGLEAVYHAPMDWGEYVAFLRGMDAGVSLMYTPHPSYPPLDLAAMGVPVLTNTFANKADLKHYSDNIIATAPLGQALLGGMADLMSLAADPEKCRSNAQTGGLNRNWEIALGDIVEGLCNSEMPRGRDVS